MHCKVLLLLVMWRLEPTVMHCLFKTALTTTLFETSVNQSQENFNKKEKCLKGTSGPSTQQVETPEDVEATVHTVDIMTPCQQGTSFQSSITGA